MAENMAEGTFAGSKGYSSVEAKMQQNSVGIKTVLSFPLNNAVLYNTHHIEFTVFSVKREARKDADKKVPIARITLPMTQELATTYNATYNDVDLGPIGKVLEGAGDAIAEAVSTGANAPGGIVAKVTAAVANLSSGVDIKKIASTGAGAALSVGVGLVEGLPAVGTGVTAALQNTLGVARNPHKSVLFGGTNFRSHSFSFRFSPMKAAESDVIKQIIKLFKYHMHPGFSKANIAGIGTGTHFFTIPEFFNIKLSNGGYYTIDDYQTCVLKNVTVNYHPSNYPAYARASGGGDPAPMEVVMNLDFQEIDIITKDVVGDPYGGHPMAGKTPYTSSSSVE